MLVRLVIVVLTVDVVLLLFGLFCLHLGRKMKKTGMSVWKHGIVPPGGTLFGKPETELEAPKAFGCLPLYGSVFAFLFGWLSLIAIPIFTVMFPLTGYLARN